MRSTSIALCHTAAADSRSVFPRHEHHRVLDAPLNKFQHYKAELCWFRFCKRRMQPGKPKPSVVGHECVWQAIELPPACNHYCSRHHWSHDQVFGPHVGNLVLFSCSLRPFVGLFINSRSSDLPERVILAISYRLEHLSSISQQANALSCLPTFHLATQRNIASPFPIDEQIEQYLREGVRGSVFAGH